MVRQGPLLFHWVDAHTYLSDEELSIEVMSLETVERLAAHYKLRLIRKEFHDCLYTSSCKSMHAVRLSHSVPPCFAS